MKLIYINVLLFKYKSIVIFSLVDQHEFMLVVDQEFLLGQSRLVVVKKNSTEI